MENPMTKRTIKPNEASNIRTLIFLLSSMCAEPAREDKKKKIEIREKERGGAKKRERERERVWVGLGEAFGFFFHHLLLLQSR